YHKCDRRSRTPPEHRTCAAAHFYAGGQRARCVHAANVKMPIILAIEPDRRQAAHLAGVVRHKVEAELILANTTEGALDAIGNRVPDMVLVPALLSPQDDAALAAALRVIAAAAHVRTLTIPVLSSGIAHAPSGGLLGKWLKGRPASQEPEGCAPA